MPVASIIIPAYNEEEGLAKVLQEIAELPHDYEVIVVDDGSTDKTKDIALNGFKLPQAGYFLPCGSVIVHDNNQGKGAAVASGIKVSSSENIVWIDADGSYPVSTIPQVVDALSNGYDGVVCSRLIGRENIPRVNRFGNWVFSVLISNLYGFAPCDPCTGLYGMRKTHLLRMALTAKRFAIEPEVSMKAGRMKLRLLEIPIKYSPRIGSTKLNIIVAGLEDITAIGRLLFWKPS